MTDKSYHHNDIDKKTRDLTAISVLLTLSGNIPPDMVLTKDSFLPEKPWREKPKIGYSVSRGVYKGWNDEIIKQFIELTSPYEAIAAREESFAEHISELLHRDIPTVLDPVF